jgi:hypothetical protein
MPTIPPTLDERRPCLDDMERRDRTGYERDPDILDDSVLWESAAVWPEDQTGKPPTDVR